MLKPEFFPSKSSPLKRSECVVNMISATSSRRLRLKCLLVMSGMTVTLYLLTHLYISYRLTYTTIEVTTNRHPFAVSPIFKCQQPPVVGSMLKRLPDRPSEGIFYVPVDLDAPLHPEHGGVSASYTVDEHFPPLLSSGETDHIMRLARKLAALLSGAGVTFTMWQGTVLGSYMTHGLLPWDDDIDFAVRWTEMPKVKLALRNAGYMWRIYNVTSFYDDTDLYSRSMLTSGDVWGRSVPNPTGKPRYHRFKFFAVDSSYAGNTTWKWPNIDVVFFHENSTHVWTHAEPEYTEVVPRAILYPLHQRPLGALWLPAPANSHAYITMRYGPHFLCSTPAHNHRKEVMVRPIAVPCCTLYCTYPIVLREAGFGGIVETLLIGNDTLHVAFIREKFIPELGPYEF